MLRKELPQSWSKKRTVNKYKKLLGGQVNKSENCQQKQFKVVALTYKPSTPETQSRSTAQS